MLSPGQVVTLTVEKPAAGGAMIARHAGQVVLVSGTIPGERVAARIDRVAKAVAFATTVAVEQASPDRRPPMADPLCGGSVYSHVAYPRQLALKSEVIADGFARIGRLTLPAPVSVAASPESGYRMRARLHVRGRRIGFFREGTHELCDARPTGQLLPATLDALDRLGAVIGSFGDAVREIELSENIAATERVVRLETSEPVDSRAADTLTSLEGFTPGPYVTDVVPVDGREIRLRRHVQAFFQGNRFLIGRLAGHVASLVTPGTMIVDLYAGSGLFSLAAAISRGASVVAVEGDRYAAADLDHNASAAAGQVVAVRSAVEEFPAAFRRGEAGGFRSPDTTIVDPPRTGLSAAALDGALTLNAARIVYVSCDIATLARDSRRIVSAGYRLARLDAFDLFPNTAHVECVGEFLRKQI